MAGWPLRELGGKNIESISTDVLGTTGLRVPVCVLHSQRPSLVPERHGELPCAGVGDTYPNTHKPTLTFRATSGANAFGADVELQPASEGTCCTPGFVSVLSHPGELSLLATVFGWVAGKGALLGRAKGLLPTRCDAVMSRLVGRPCLPSCHAGFFRFLVPSPARAAETWPA